MATTVGQHPVSAFTSPKNGDPLDANVVVSNDNTVRVAYVDHDSDPGIHLQSSSYASRPSAGTDGRKWVTFNSGRYQLWYDDGSRWHEVASDAVNVDCLADTALNKGDVVKITGFNNGQNLPTVAKVASASDVAFGIVETSVSINTLVQVINTGLIEDVDTNGYAVGTILYPNTSGGFTTTKPTSGSYQPAAYVLRGNTNSGVLYVEFSSPRFVEASANTASTIVRRDASGNFSAGTISAALTGNVTGNASTATTLQTARNINGVSFNGSADITVPAAAGTLTGSTLASGVTASSLTSVGTLDSLAVGTGGFSVATSGIVYSGSTGNVGIGTALPADLFTVHGNPMRVGQTSTAEYVQIGSTGLGGWVEQYGSVNLSITNIGNNAIIFGTNSIARARFENAGNFIPSADNSYSLGKSGARWSAVWAANGTIQTSDETTKADISDSDLGLDFISALRPVSFRWKVRHNEVVRVQDGTEMVQVRAAVLDDEGREIRPAVMEERPKYREEIIAHPGVRRHYGLLAQQVKAVLGEKDFGGYICDTETGEQGLRYDQFVPALIKAVQEQQAMIVALQAEVASLKAS